MSSTVLIANYLSLHPLMDMRNPNGVNAPHTHFLTETALLSCGF